MKTLEAKPCDQNAENWKRENRLFTSTVLEAGASGAKSNWYARTQKSSNSLIRFRCSNSFFLLETGIAGHEKLFLAKWHPKAEKKLLFDTADRHEKLYGRSRLYASAQGRHETGGVLSLFFESFLWHFSKKQRVEVIFRLSRPVSCKNQENGPGKQWSLHAPLKNYDLRQRVKEWEKERSFKPAKLKKALCVRLLEKIHSLGSRV